MESSPLILVLLLINTFGCIVIAIGVWRLRTGSGSGLLAARLSESESRLSAEVQRIRDALERSLREVQNSQAGASLELGQRLSHSSEESSKRLNETIAGRFESFSSQLQAWQRATTESMAGMQERFLAAAAAARQESATSHLASRKELSEKLAENSSLQTRTLRDLQEQMGARLEAVAGAQAAFFQEIKQTIGTSLEALRVDNEQRLEKLRVTVDEKLQQTLSERLGESFRQVSERLEQVHKGLGEMQQLATGVGDLKRVLTNVRSRGTYGEVQLRGLLEQVMLPGQYRENVATVPGSSNRVEFAICLPGKNQEEATVLLPIDAKFPQEDYLRLLSAYETGDHQAIEESRRALGTRVLGEAKSIRTKYIHVPETTDFALLFLPTEGLFAEVLRLDGLAERAQREHHIVLVGPTTLYAVLNSLQMGFRTLALERRSSEVWKVLGAVKTEFGKFSEALNEAQRSIEMAGKKITILAETRTKAMARQLRNLEALPESEAHALIPDLTEEP